MAYWGQPWNGAPAGAMRASHADRERAVDVLKAAFAEGRLTQAEYEQRVETAYRSATYGELGRLVADLPIGPVPPAAFPTAVPAAFAAAPPSAPVAYTFPGFPPPPELPPMNGLAVASLMCGMAGLVVGVPALPAIVLGHRARSEIRAHGGAGERAAAAGLALGWLAVSLWALILLFLFTAAG